MTFIKIIRLENKKQMVNTERKENPLSFATSNSDKLFLHVI